MPPGTVLDTTSGRRQYGGYVRHAAFVRQPPSGRTTEKGLHVDPSLAPLAYDRQVTSLLVIDPCNDLISEGGKLWSRLKAVAEANGCVLHMAHVLKAARKAGVRVFFCPGLRNHGAAA